ncbi:MAG: hypothetical protein QOF26_1785 [Baekduia sp.]|jgi:nucleoside-diphosphate-sugar epimerase|nr:hypothetical protein [Baekduia sp.]MDX6701559.1 hypothetical protein [Baekduia sp.]
MRIFLAGATGAVGKRLLPMLIDDGHEVVALTRDAAKADALRAAGAMPVVADALDREAVLGAVLGAEPDVVVHQLTALQGMGDMKHFDDDFAQTNRLRTEGLAILLDAAQAAGARRAVVQSYTGWPFAAVGGAVKDEDAPLATAEVPAAQRRTLAAIRELEARTLDTPGVEGVVLRYGALYGPGTSLGADGDITALVRRRRLPVVGDGGGVWSFTHIDDAAGAVLAALAPGGPAGVFQIVDDEPAPVREWLPALAAAVGAKPPRRIPAWLGRLAVGDAGVRMMTATRGAANARARQELGWTPRHPRWSAGFRQAM